MCHGFSPRLIHLSFGHPILIMGHPKICEFTTEMIEIGHPIIIQNEFWTPYIARANTNLLHAVKTGALLYNFYLFLFFNELRKFMTFFLNIN